MKNVIYLVFYAILFVKLASVEGTEIRVKRQIYYKDIQNKPKSFRSRPEEKESSSDVQDISSQFPAVNLDSIVNLVSGSTRVLKPKPILEYENILHPKPVHQEPLEPKPFDKDLEYSYPRPNVKISHFTGYPVKSKSVHKQANVGYQLLHPKPIPAYEEPHIPKSSIHVAKPIVVESYQQNRLKIREKKNPIPGIPGEDYPLYEKVPPTHFSCSRVPFRPGMYANPETRCQAYHVCHDNRHGDQGAAFLCTNGTLFSQETFSCDWWYKVDCNKATSFYGLNTDPEYNPYYQKPYEKTQKGKHKELHLQYSKPSVTVISSFNIPKPSSISREAIPPQHIVHHYEPGADSATGSKVSGDFKREVTVNQRQNQVPRQRIRIGSTIRRTTLKKGVNDIAKKTSIISSQPKQVKSSPLIIQLEQKEAFHPNIQAVEARTTPSSIHLEPVDTSSFNLQFAEAKTTPSNALKEDAKSQPLNIQPVEAKAVLSNNQAEQRKPLPEHTRITQTKASPSRIKPEQVEILYSNIPIEETKASPSNFLLQETETSTVQLDQATATSDIETEREEKLPSNTQEQVLQGTKRTIHKPQTIEDSTINESEKIGTRFSVNQPLNSPSTLPGRRILRRRRKKPRPSKLTLETDSKPVHLQSVPPEISTRRLKIQAAPGNSQQVILEELPEDAFVDFEWGQRS